MTNERAGKEASATVWPMGNQGNVLVVGLGINMTLKLKSDMVSRLGE